MEQVLIPAPEMIERLPKDVDFLFSILLTRQDDALTGTIATWQDQPFARTTASFEYLRALVAWLPEAARDGLLREPGRQIILQAGDYSVDVPSLAFEAHGETEHVRLIPDLCYYDARGYETRFATVPDWSARRPVAIWRGSSTGMTLQTTDTIADLPRYRLCVAAAALGDVIDAKLSAIVQAATPADEDDIRRHCAARGLLGDFVQPDAMAHHRMLIDIDGNSNSWNAIARFRMGCCVLRVDSEWRQWFHDGVKPWEHYVPVRADLSDLGERIRWCLDNDAAASEIAARGRDFALAMRFDDEMTAAAECLLSV